MEPLRSGPTPPLPIRNPNRRWRPLPPLPDARSNPELVPMPLFSTITLHVIVHDIPQPFPSSDSEMPSSPTTSVRSSSSSIISTPNSPVSQPGPLTYSVSPPKMEYLGSSWEKTPMPRHSLRRKQSPKKESLRSLRAKESDACLQRCYDQQLDAYLNGSLFQKEKWKEDLGMVEEE